MTDIRKSDAQLDRDTFIEPLYGEMERQEVAPFSEEPGVFWVMSKARAEWLWSTHGVGEMNMRGNRLFGFPILFSDSVPDPIIAFDRADR